MFRKFLIDEGLLDKFRQAFNDDESNAHRDVETWIDDHGDCSPAVALSFAFWWAEDYEFWWEINAKWFKRLDEFAANWRTNRKIKTEYVQDSLNRKVLKQVKK
jgi:hypothetical protein